MMLNRPETGSVAVGSTLGGMPGHIGTPVRRQKPFAAPDPVIEIQLTEQEQAALNKSAAAVEELKGVLAKLASV